MTGMELRLEARKAIGFSGGYHKYVEPVEAFLSDFADKIRAEERERVLGMLESCSKCGGSGVEITYDSDGNPSQEPCGWCFTTGKVEGRLAHDITNL